MRNFILIISKLKYLGLLGLPTLISDAAIWNWLLLFWLFGILEIILTFTVFLQSLWQMAGMVYMVFKYNTPPDKDNYAPQVIYSLPFAGSWVAVNGGVVKENSHSWDIATQRYAYDFIMLDESGKSFSGSGSAVTDYHCYGKQIVAPADGVVVEASNACKDSKILGKGRPDPLIKDLRRNYIIIQHAENEYSMFAHLMPNSILVRPGQQVKRKEPIALCGNSGNTTEPHLHFHVQNGRSFYTSVGLPIHFQDIQAVACPNYAVYDKRAVIIEAGPDNAFISRGQSVSNI